MAAYNGQGNYSTNRNFVSSFPRNNLAVNSEDRSMRMRRPFERDAPMFQGYQSSETGSFSSRPQPSFSGYDEQTRGPSMLLDRPTNMVNTGNPMAGIVFTQNTFTRPDFAGQNMFRRSEFGGEGVFAGSKVNGRNAYPRSELGNREVFSRPEFSGSGILRSELRSGNRFPRPQLRSGGMFSTSPMGNGNMHSRPHLGSGNMFSRNQLNSGNGAFSRPQFNGTPMAGIPPRMHFPYGGGRANQRPPPSMQWNSGPNSFTRRPGSQNFGVSPEKKPFAATQQNRPKFKAAQKKLNRFSRLKDDGKKLKPWMTDELYVEVKKKNEMYVKAKVSDSAEMWQEFRLQRNKVSSLIKEAKLKGGFITRRKKEDEDNGKERLFSCDTCDKAYVEESKLEEHLKEHKKCEINGCQFEAHPKVIELHKKLQHDTGYADIISKLDDAAEIEKWRNERKSHFPTLENVKKRQAEQEEKLARGEILETRDFGSKNGDGKDNTHNMLKTQEVGNPPEDTEEDIEAESGEMKTVCQLGN